jgi:RNA polymerase sigma factor (sigma-70 family)
VISDIARRRFKELAMPHLDDAYALARWLTGQPIDAEDVVQEACLKALRAFETSSPDRPRAYFLTITRNAAYSWLSKNRPQALVLAGGAEDVEMRDDARVGLEPSPEEALIAAADRATVTQAIESLPIIFKEVLVMREINGLSYREIAEAIGSPIGTVMSRLARARSLLTKALGETG